MGAVAVLAAEGIIAWLNVPYDLAAVKVEGSRLQLGPESDPAVRNTRNAVLTAVGVAVATETGMGLQGSILADSLALLGQSGGNPAINGQLPDCIPGETEDRVLSADAVRDLALVSGWTRNVAGSEVVAVVDNAPPAPEETNEEFDRSFDLPRHLIPSSHEEAVARIRPLLACRDRQAFKAVSAEDFKKGWFAISFLMPGLHPDGSTEVNTPIKDAPLGELPDWIKGDLSIATPFYEESGWPVALVPIASEAWRRSRNGLLEENELYAVDAARQGEAFMRGQAENRAVAERVFGGEPDAQAGEEPSSETPRRGRGR